METKGKENCFELGSFWEGWECQKAGFDDTDDVDDG